MTKKDARRMRVKKGIRKKVYGTQERPRLTVFRSNENIYAQIINDDAGKTLASASSRVKAFAGFSGTKSQVSEAVGKLLAEKAKSIGVEKVVFDRNGFKYHGRIKALADGARAGGLDF